MARAPLSEELRLAAYEGCPEKLAELLKGDLDAADERGRTALFWCVLHPVETEELMEKRWQCQRLLLEARCSPLWRDRQGLTVKDYIQEQKLPLRLLKSTKPQAEVVKQVAQSQDPQWLDPLLGQTSIHRAALHGQKDKLLRALRSGINAGRQDVFGRTALHLAALQKHFLCCRVILQVVTEQSKDSAMHLMNTLDSFGKHALGYGGIFCDFPSRADIFGEQLESASVLEADWERHWHRNTSPEIGQSPGKQAQDASTAKELEDLRQERESLQQGHRELQAACEEKSHQMKALQKAHKELQDDNKKLKETKKSLSESNEQLTESLRSSKADLSKLQKELELCRKGLAEAQARRSDQARQREPEAQVAESSEACEERPKKRKKISGFMNEITGKRDEKEEKEEKKENHHEKEKEEKDNEKDDKNDEKEKKKELYLLHFHDSLRRPIFYGMPGFQEALEDILKAKPESGEPAWLWSWLEAMRN